jgi:heterodisulfide reductase subunit A
MNTRLGIYICHCGGNISDYVDVDRLKNAVEKEEGIVVTRTTLFACGDSNQREMVEDIQNNKLDGIVVASCSPKLHLTTFRAVVERAGLNQYQYVHANIREQASWAHSDDKGGATLKAIQLVKAAIAKVRYAEALAPIRITAEKSVAVVGGGIAGIKAALALADLGCRVWLIEKSPFVGGRVSQWDTLFTTEETGKDLISRLYRELSVHDNISVYTNAEITAASGSIGAFHLQVKLTPRYIKSPCHQGYLQQAIEACPVEIPDPFNFQVTSRKAIYHNFPGEFPQSPVIDMEHCTRCGVCESMCEQVDFSEEEQLLNIHVGSVLVATGFDPYTPTDNEFGYNRLDNVITLPQFKRLIDLCEKKLVFKDRVIRNIAYIYCVGSRQTEGDNKFCSRYCCTSAIHTAIAANKKFGSITNFHFNRGIRTYGKQETFYKESLLEGDIYLQSFEDDPPAVTANGGKTTVRIKDILTGKQELEVEVFKLPRGRDRFFNEIHMKLRPVETVIDGITIAGACQGPKNITESVNSALSAASKSYSYISKGELELEPLVIRIHEESCTWCGACAEACPYGAILKSDGPGREIAMVNTSVCKGCGMCLPVCPPDAIDLIGSTNAEIESMIDALA